MKSSSGRWHDGLLLAQIMGLVFLAVSYLRIVGDSQSVTFRTRILESLYAGPIWGTKLGNNLILFAAAVLLVHVLYATACWMLGRMSARAWPSLQATRGQHVLLWFVVVTAGLLANNAAVFVQSSLGEPYAEQMTQVVFGVPLGRAIWIGVLVAAAVTVAVASVRWWLGGGRLSRRSALTLGAVGIAYVAVSAHSFILPAQAPDSSTKPNVILIGLDSFREDLVDARFSPHVTPNLEAFLAQSTRFSNAMTPLARTFPSLSSMLTGRHPHHSGAVMNLLPRKLVDDSESLPRVLARNGYHTAYATDEVRFANIDTSFGFAQTITPPIGASEFLIEKLADVPVTNLLVNTRLGKWLFPHLHANRGAAVTYDPDTFVRRVDDELGAHQPLFFNVHLTLDHWPYTWAGAPIIRQDDTARWAPFYLNAAKRVDQQFGDILDVLERKGMLKNAIVVAYSDHGESFGSPHESLVPDEDALLKSLGHEQLWGHGTSVLTTHQFHIVLGMRATGENWQAGRESAAPVSFEDIAPTLIETLGLKTSARFDGRSLVSLLEGREGAEKGFEGRIRFTETEYQPPAGFATQDGKLSVGKIQDALAIYSVDRVTDRITVKESHLGKLLMERHYAAIGDHSLVAALPNKTGAGFSYLVVPLAGGEPRQVFSAPAADAPELLALWNALHAQFDDVLLRRHIDAPAVAAPAVANHDRTIPQGVTK
jgi:arylsulfatase A-like enzyme